MSKKELINRLGFSPSTERDWIECPRRVAIRRLCAWKGWEKDAPGVRRLAYRLSKLTPFAARVGSIIHETIEHVISRGLTSPDKAVRDALIEAAESQLREDWVTSKSDAWLTSPSKSVRFLEHHYHLWDTDEAVRSMFGRIRRALTWFFESPVQAILANSSEQVCTEVLLTFEAAGKLCYAKIDHAQIQTLTSGMRGFVALGSTRKLTGQPILAIFDWKTGRVASDLRRKGIDVGAYYGYALTATGGVPADDEEPDQPLLSAEEVNHLEEFFEGNPPRALVRFEYLNDQETRGGRIKRKDLAEAERHIAAFWEDPLWQKLERMVKGDEEPDIEAFPISGRRGAYACARCQMFEFCFGSTDQESVADLVDAGEGVCE